MHKKTILLSLLLSCTLITTAQNYNTNSLEEVRNYDHLLLEMSKEKMQSTIDRCEFKGDATITFDDSIYINRLYALPSTMELAFNPAVKSFIEMYARRRSQVGYMLGEGQYLFPMFEEALDKEGVPLELKYLAVIESALNPIARSRVGAMGLWQFMPATGRMYNLEINSLVDERCDPLKSTAAAAKYLKYLYNIYGDWNLVIAAYNCGPGNVNKAIRRSGGQTDFWVIYPYLPKETRGYVPIFIAATYIMNYHNEHNICPQMSARPASMDTLMIDKTIHFQQIADVINVPIEDIRKYNPQFKSDIIPGEYKPYALHLPINKVTAFIDNKDAILAHRSQELLSHRKVAGVDVVGKGAASGNGSSLKHKVRKGETLSTISRKYGVTIAQVKKWNKLKSNSVPVGRRLTIYSTPTPPVKKEQPSTTEQLASTKTPVTEEYAQAQVQNKSASKPQKTMVVNAEEQLNGGRSVSTAKTETQTQIITSYYKVRKGDTWSSVAKKNNATIAEIKKWNSLKSNTLIAGKSLKILKTVRIEVPVEEVAQLAEPQLSTVELDSVYTNDLLNSYMKKVERDEASLPLVSLPNEETFTRNKSDDERIIYHKVKIGETITQIAAQYNVTKKDIVSWNKLSSNSAKVGQRLLIRLPEDKQDSSYTIQNTNTASKAQL